MGAKRFLVSVEHEGFAPTTFSHFCVVFGRDVDAHDVSMLAVFEKEVCAFFERDKFGTTVMIVVSNKNWNPRLLKVL